MTILADKVFEISRSVIADSLETGLALTMIGSSKILILNSTGVAIWQLFDGYISCRQIVERVALQFSVPNEKVIPDVYAFIEQLALTGLILEKNNEHNNT